MRHDAWTSRRIQLATLTMLLAACGPEPGFQAVEEWCSRDGGEHLYDTVYVGGYLANSKSARCIECRGYLSMRAFEFVDVFVEPDKSSRDITGPGYYRFSLGAAGDPTCYPLGDDGEFFWTKKSWQIPDDRCLVVERLSEGASTVTWERRGETIPIGGDRSIVRDEHVVIDLATNRILASHRDYAYTSKTSRFFGALAGGASPDARCNRAGLWTDLSGFLQRALRDPARLGER